MEAPPAETPPTGSSEDPSSPSIDLDRRLGQLLVERGWLTSDRVRRAFETQMVTGGMLGTCLLELGLVTEDRLLEALSEVHGVPPASAADLSKVRSNAIAQLPGSVAQRHRAAPFRIVGGELWLALVEPGNEQTLHELSEISRRTLRPHVTTEPRLLEALSSFYAQPIPPRFSLLLGRLNRPPALWEESRAQAAKVITLSEEERQALKSRPAPPPTTAPVAPTLPSSKRKPATPPPSASNPALEAKLAQANDLDEIGRTVLAAVAGLAERDVLFKVRGEKVLGWLGRGSGLDEKALSRFELGFDEPSVFLNLRQGAGVHLGPLPNMPSHRAVAKLWHGSAPQAAVVAPVLVRGRLVAVYFGDRGRLGLSGVDLKELHAAMSACAAALELHLMQRKARKT